MENVWELKSQETRTQTAAHVEFEIIYSGYRASRNTCLLSYPPERAKGAFFCISKCLLLDVDASKPIIVAIPATVDSGGRWTEPPNAPPTLREVACSRVGVTGFASPLWIQLA
jgi:hypothetical protein